MKRLYIASSFWRSASSSEPPVSIGSLSACPETCLRRRRRAVCACESRAEGPLYYRNPMGAPDTSPVPKKDTMGMDYIPVYADEQDDPVPSKLASTRSSAPA